MKDRVGGRIVGCLGGFDRLVSKGMVEPSGSN